MAEVDLAAAQYAVRKVSKHFGFAEVVIDVSGRATEGLRLLLDVAGESLEARDEDVTCGLKLLGEGVSQGQGARLNNLNGGDEH